MILNKKLMLLTTAFSALSYIAQAQSATIKEIYTYAKNRDYTALENLKNSINIKDKNGNTALCLALMSGDAQAYKTLQQYGADVNIKCNISYGISSGDSPYYGYYQNGGYYPNGGYAPQPASSGKFLGMGPVGWTVVGVLAVGGGAAAIAAGGGGGGGGSSSSSGNNSNNSGGNNGGNGGSQDNSTTKYLDNEPITDTDNGQEIVGKTISISNFESDEDYLKAANNGTIKKIVESKSAVSGIVSESTFTSSAVSIGGNKKADIIIAQRGSGDVYGIKGAQSNTANNTNSDDEDGAIFNATATGNGIATGNITIRNTGSGTGNIYGLQSKGNIYVGNALGIQELWEDDYEIDESSSSATGNILIENINSNKNVYGIYSEIEAINAESDDNAKVKGNITIKNSGNGNVYGIKTSKDNTRNAGATENSEATALIDIKNTGNGNVYGMNEDKNYPDGDLYNAQASEHKSYEGDYKEEYPAKATATINIENTGTGNVYGIKALTNIYNAHSYYNSTAIGKITISNNGNGNAYGIHGNSVIKNASAHSDSPNNYATAKGYVNILNKSNGNVYGLYSNTTGNYVMNNSESDGETQESVIELTNQGNGLAVGIYSKNGTAENSGDIKIHNLADGVAVGIYADGTTNATNSGNIIIDRGEKSTKGGKAIGIYGAAGSNITNTADGIIRINGADKAYGIYTEGSNVTNNGKIYIDNVLKTDQCTGSDCLSQNHAIVLNGGTLFQNGTLYADSAWYNPCQSVTCGANATCSVVGNSGVCKCNAGYEGNANTGCTLIAEDDEDLTDVDTGKEIIKKSLTKANNVENVGVAGNQTAIKAVVDSRSAVIGINAPDDIEAGNAVGISTNKTASVDITQYGTGDVYGMRHRDLSDRGEPQDEDDYMDMYNAVGYKATGTIKIKDTGGKIVVNNADDNGNIYGMYSNAMYMDLSNALVADDSSASDTVRGTIEITAYGDNHVHGIYSQGEAVNAEGDSKGHAIANINITNNGDGEVYGIETRRILYNAEATDTSSAEATVTIKNYGTGNGNVYGLLSVLDDVDNAKSGHERDYGEPLDAATAIGTIDIDNLSSGDVYGIRAGQEADNACAYDNSEATGTLIIKNKGNGNVYGIQATYSINANAETEIEENQTAEAVAKGVINISNTGNGDIYGMKANGYAANAVADTYVEFSSYNKKASTTSTGRIRLDNSGNGKMYGIYSNSDAENAVTYIGSNSTTGTVKAKATGIINLINKGDGYAYGMYASKALNKSNTNATSTIEMVNKGNGLAVGIYSQDGKVENSGDIKIHNLGSGKAIGIYADGETNVTNSGTITIDRASYKDDMATESTSDDVLYTADSSTTDMAIGIYGAAGSTITNTGTIKINGASLAYGIYTEGDASSVNNTGTILINDKYPDNSVVLNGATLFQNGVLTTTSHDQNSPMSESGVKPASLNLNDFGGTVVASDTSQFIIEGAISGDLAINNSVIENGFDTTYSVKDMIQAEDISGLNLQSQSALFNATLQNNTDAVMTMKAFNDVVENSSIADFLQNNYAANNNEDLFKTLKSVETVAELNSNIDDLFGKNMLSRMAFEDLSMLREVSFDMNNHLFEKKGAFEFGGNISPSSYDDNIGSVGRYSLNGYNNGKTSFGLGMSITDVRTNDSHNDNRRFDRNFMMSAPIGHKTYGFELITAPKMGYADGTYERDGFNNMTYDGKIQKRMFALMNEARYPLKFGGLKLIPSAEFNMIGYNIKGSEDEKQYALRIKSQNHYSVEAGFGLLAEKEFKPFKDHKFNVNGGVAVYHEFANPYELEVGMNGMDGYYKLQDERRSDNRAVVRFGFDYDLKDNLDISASWLTNIDREYRTDANLDLKYHF